MSNALPQKPIPSSPESVPARFQIYSDQIVTIAGMRGTGKTTLTKIVGAQFANPYFYDPLDQYGDVAPDARRCLPSDDSIEEFEEKCRWVWNEGNMTFVVEEAEQYLGERMMLTPYAAKIVRRSRNRGIGLVVNTRRIAELSKTVFGLSDHVFLFRFFSPNDIKYCSEFIGKSRGSRLQEMPKFHFLYYGPEGRISECPPLAV